MTHVKGDMPCFRSHTNIHQHRTTTILETLPHSHVVFRGCGCHVRIGYVIVEPPDLLEIMQEGRTLTLRTIF